MSTSPASEDKDSVPTGSGVVAPSATGAGKTVGGYLTKLSSGATVWMARLASESFALKFTNKDGVETAFTLSPEAMKAVIGTHADLTDKNAFIEGGSYVRPSQWQVVIKYAATVLDVVSQVGTPAKQSPDGEAPITCEQCRVILNDYAEAEGCKDPQCWAQERGREVGRLSNQPAPEAT